MMSNHTFVICAYKESEYLEECIASLKRQNIVSNIIMATSTPNPMIKELSEKYTIPLYINKGESGITQDWNFALGNVKTRYATIAHQDDIYEPDYTQKILNYMENSNMPLIAFSDYYELRNGRKILDNSILKIKKMMLLPLRFSVFRSSRFVRRRVLSLGDPICCPSVTFCMDNLPQLIFSHGFRSCEDWEAWEKISRLKGDFLYMSR